MRHGGFSLHSGRGIRTGAPQMRFTVQSVRLRSLRAQETGAGCGSGKVWAREAWQQILYRQYRHGRGWNYIRMYRSCVGERRRHITALMPAPPESACPLRQMLSTLQSPAVQSLVDCCDTSARRAEPSVNLPCEAQGKNHVGAPGRSTQARWPRPRRHCHGESFKTPLFGATSVKIPVEPTRTIAVAPAKSSAEEGTDRVSVLPMALTAARAPCPEAETKVPSV